MLRTWSLIQTVSKKRPGCIVFFWFNFTYLISRRKKKHICAQKSNNNNPRQSDPFGIRVKEELRAELKGISLKREEKRTASGLKDDGITSKNLFYRVTH